MALDFLTKASPEKDNEKDVPAIPEAIGDPERQGSRKMSRIRNPPALSDTDSGLSVGAQIDLEKENAIQYRTCGWKKVSLYLDFGIRPLVNVIFN